MRNYFIFQYEDLVSTKKKTKVTVIFVHQAKISNQNTLAQELNLFFQENSITDKLIVIVPEYLDESSLEFFTTTRDITFARVPGKTEEYFNNCLSVYKFNSIGGLTIFAGKKQVNEAKFFSNLFRSGSTLIFRSNGGLVESTPDHHFVFPSKKHCSKFIRTGNVLINQCEIFFLACQLLKHIVDKNIIYCDTSSINVLPYVVFELKRRFGIEFECPIVHSFESYEVFEQSNDSFAPEALILISSSTSGNIIDRIIKERRADKLQMQVIYFLGSSERYLIHNQNIICNLTMESEFPMGEVPFEAYGSEEKCLLCAKHSRPIHIRSDVFLTIQPKIEKHLLTVRPEYAPRVISTFVENYRCKSSSDSVIKTYFKDSSPDANYEIYFDFVKLIAQIEQYPVFKESLNKQIDKHIPANTKFLLYLPDSGSEKLAEYIVSCIPNEISPTLVRLDKNFIEKIDAETGAVVIVASCITTGKKLLQISRLMRSKENLNLVYFVGIYRPISDKFSTDLVNDLKKGKNKSDERPFVAVETINCSIQQTETSWELENVFFQEMLGELNESTESDLYKIVNTRLDILRDNKKQRGLSDNVFLKCPDGSNLFLRKNFAFWSSFQYEEDKVSQSEVYFTISTIISFLEQKPINSHPSLKQSNYVRNILSPRNFHRFNDGIIQAALLRSGKSEYFAYELDSESSMQMKEFLLSLVAQHDTTDSEAILEFLLALGLKRLRLSRGDLKEVLESANACPNVVISTFSKYLSKKLLES